MLKIKIIIVASPTSDKSSRRQKMGPSFVSKHRLRKKTFSGREKKILGFESTPNRDEILIPMVRVHLGVVAVADDTSTTAALQR